MSNTVPTIPNAERLDVIYNSIQSAMNSVSWISSSYGLTYKTKEDRTEGSYILPKAYNSKREYIPIEPSDEFIAFSFIEKNGNENVTFYEPGSSDHVMETELGLIVFANIEKIDNTIDYIFDQLLKKDVMLALEGVGAITSVNSIDDGIDNAWTNYGYSTFDKRYYSQNYVTFRLNLTVTINDRCDTANVFNLISCQS